MAHISEKIFPVVVVGAGPAGTACSITLLLHGVCPVYVLERSTSSGEKPCAGGLGPSAFRRLEYLGLWDEVKREANRVTSLFAVSPSGGSFAISGIGSGYILQRTRIDDILLSRAVELGAVVLRGERVVKLLEEEGCCCGVYTAKGEVFRSVWTVLAAGGTGRGLAEELIDFNRGTYPFGKSTMASFVARYEGVEFSPSTVEMYFDKSFIPFYGWLFPENEKTVNIGFCCSRSRVSEGVSELFNSFVRRYIGGRLKGARRVYPVRGCPIFTSIATHPVGMGGLLVVGEAGYLVNPATGEGIAQAIFSGICAGEAIASHLRGRCSAADAVGSYENRIKQTLRPEFLMSDFFKRFSPYILDFAGYLYSKKVFKRAFGLIAGRHFLP